MSNARRITWATSFLPSGMTEVGHFIAGYQLDVPPGETRVEAVLDTAPDLSLLLSFGRMVPLDERMPYAALTRCAPDAGVLDPYAAATGKILYLVRDPRSLIAEAVLSRKAGPEQRIDLAKKLISRIDAPAEKGKASWLTHVRDWTSPDRARHRFPGLEDIRVVRLEEVHADPAGALRQILEFLGLPDTVDDARIQRAVKHWTAPEVQEADLLAMPPGFSAFMDLEPPRAGIPGVLPSLDEIGHEVEAAYRQRLRDNEEFVALLRRYGYES